MGDKKYFFYFPKRFLSDSLWHRVIMDKYFKNFSVVQWIRLAKKPTKRVCNIWSCLVSSFKSSVISVEDAYTESS